MGQGIIGARTVGQHNFAHEMTQITLILVECGDVAFARIFQGSDRMALAAPIHDCHPKSAIQQVADGLEVFFDEFAASGEQANGSLAGPDAWLPQCIADACPVLPLDEAGHAPRWQGIFRDYHKIGASSASGTGSAGGINIRLRDRFRRRCGPIDDRACRFCLRGSAGKRQVGCGLGHQGEPLNQKNRRDHAARLSRCASFTLRVTQAAHHRRLSVVYELPVKKNTPGRSPAR